MRPIELFLSNRQQDVTLDLAQVRLAAERIFSGSHDREIQINISLVDDFEMKDLHGRFLADPTTTDVLTFVDHEKGQLEVELIANGPYAKREANHFGWPAKHELLLYVIHGLLHAAGMDDRTSADREAMFSKQREVLVYLGLDPAQIHRVVDTAEAGSWEKRGDLHPESLHDD